MNDPEYMDPYGPQNHPLPSTKKSTGMRIEIKTLIDTHDCETCGCSWAEGGQVYIDGKLVFERVPRAYCYDSPTFSEADLLVMALKKEGHEVFVDGFKYDICSHDEEYHGYKLST